MSAGFVHFYDARPGDGPAPIQAVLLRQGMGVRLYRDANTLCDVLAGHAVQGEARLVMLAGTLAQVCRAARAVRRVDARVVAVALLSCGREAFLPQAMRSGIDACWHDDAPARLVAASLIRLMDHAGRAGSPETRPPAGGPIWRLSSSAWVVQAPGGAVIELTATERALVLALWRAPGQSLTHAEIQHAIDHARPASHGRPAARRLSVLLSRLRHKFLVAGLDMPIRSVRGVGYGLYAVLDDASVNH